MSLSDMNFIAKDAICHSVKNPMLHRPNLCLGLKVLSKEPLNEKKGGMVKQGTGALPVGDGNISKGYISQNEIVIVS